MLDAVDAEVRAFYAGDLAQFVPARTALAKRLRADGCGDEAAAVKGLRKPGRRAWALDRAVADHPEALARLLRAAGEVAAAQEGGGDLRATGAELRDAVRSLAARTGDPAIATADLLAVVADPDALAALAAGRLAEVPEGGGFGPLPTGPPAARPAEVTDEVAAQRRRSAQAAVADAEAARSAAADAHAEAVSRLAAAQAAVRTAADRLAAADAALLDAQSVLGRLELA